MATVWSDSRTKDLADQMNAVTTHEVLHHIRYESRKLGNNCIIAVQEHVRVACAHVLQRPQDSVAARQCAGKRDQISRYVADKAMPRLRARKSITAAALPARWTRGSSGTSRVSSLKDSTLCVDLSHSQCRRRSWRHTRDRCYKCQPHVAAQPQDPELGRQPVQVRLLTKKH